jgi:hypothetical protein
MKVDDESGKGSEEKENEKREENEKKEEKPKDKEVPEPKSKEISKPESFFSTLVKMSSGKNPTTFTLPPELKCNTVFPGRKKRFFYQNFQYFLITHNKPDLFHDRKWSLGSCQSQKHYCDSSFLIFIPQWAFIKCHHL